MRNNLQKIASETKLPDDWKKYKQLRNNINNRLKHEKKNYRRNKLESLDKNSSKAWKQFKGWLGWSSGGPPKKLFSDNKEYNKPSELAKIMNEFFINKVKTLRKNIPIGTGDPLIDLRRIMKNRKCTFDLKPIHPDQVIEIISKMKSTKTVGIDNIDAFVIKLAKDMLTPAITHIINLSIEYKIFPSSWKTAKIIPLHKKQDKTFPQNYRPVALLPVFSKITEKAIFL